MHAPIDRTHTVTITLTVPTIVHLVIGVIIAAAAVAAFAIHFDLPTAHQYRETASDIGNLLGCTVLAYWLWCTLQQGRVENARLSEIITAAVEEAAEREDRVCAKLDVVMCAMLGALQEVAEAVRHNGEHIKGLDDAITEATGAVEALQDCYIAEGTALILPASAERKELPRHDRP